jgi:hypothetical protein
MLPLHKHFLRFGFHLHATQSIFVYIIYPYMDDFWYMGMGCTGIERGVIDAREVFVTEMISLIANEATQPDEADRPSICIHCSGIQHVCRLTIWTRLRTSRRQVAAEIVALNQFKMGHCFSASQLHSLSQEQRSDAACKVYLSKTVLKKHVVAGVLVNHHVQQVGDIWMVARGTRHTYLI